MRHPTHWARDFPCGQWSRGQAPQLALAGMLMCTHLSLFLYLLANLLGLAPANHTPTYDGKVHIKPVAYFYYNTSVLILSPDLSAVWEGWWVEAHLRGISDCCQLGHDCCSLHQVWAAKEHKHTTTKITATNGHGYEPHTHWFSVKWSVLIPHHAVYLILTLNPAWPSLKDGLGKSGSPNNHPLQMSHWEKKSTLKVTWAGARFKSSSCQRI